MVKKKSVVKKPEISIIIRAKNEAEKIGLCLKKIFSQKTMRKFEVLIFYGESDDDTLKIAQKYPVKILFEKDVLKNFNYGAAINESFKYAKGSYLVLLSANAITIGEKWLENLVSGIDSTTAGTYGMQLPNKDCNELEKCLIKMSWNRRIDEDESRPHFSNVNSVVNKSIWRKFKFSDKISASEDIEWAIRVKEAGYKLVYKPNARVLHSHNDSYGVMYVRHLRELTAKSKMFGKKYLITKDLFPPFKILYDLKLIIKNKISLSYLFYAIIKLMMIMMVRFKILITRRR